MGNLFYFIFLTFPSFSFVFSKTEKAVQKGGGEGLKMGPGGPGLMLTNRDKCSH
mgnify:CR=1 FL=1